MALTIDINHSKTRAKAAAAGSGQPVMPQAMIPAHRVLWFLDAEVNASPGSRNSGGRDGKPGLAATIYEANTGEAQQHHGPGRRLRHGSDIIQVAAVGDVVEFE